MELSLDFVLCASVCLFMPLLLEYCHAWFLNSQQKQEHIYSALSRFQIIVLKSGGNIVVRYYIWSARPLWQG